jgi:ectoine hydroxylase-related dioxygenase (phytanoyl-CoA dioxygenase family)
MGSNELAQWLDGRSFDDWCEQFDEQGYLVFENVLPPIEIERIREALAPHIGANMHGRNDFEGFDSNRVYGLLAKSPVFAELVLHPLQLAFAEADLGTSCLLSACLAIQLNPGETVQPWHYDDAHLRVSRPRPSWGVSTFWAIDDTTEENGATEILPGSHLWESNNISGDSSAATFEVTDVVKPGAEGAAKADPGAHPDALKMSMPAGSLMIAKGTLWHRGGANLSDKARLIVTPQYCPGWARQLENMLLAVPAEIAATLPKRAQELIGYSIHPPFMGYVDGMHPQRVLAPK